MKYKVGTVVRHIQKGVQMTIEDSKPSDAPDTSNTAWFDSEHHLQRANFPDQELMPMWAYLAVEKDKREVRDEFALAALTGMLANTNTCRQMNPNEAHAHQGFFTREMGEQAYRIADQMIQIRDSLYPPAVRPSLVPAPATSEGMKVTETTAGE
jgi:hypothetical protein